MSIFEGVILGVVQGITEFLPISSTGHLIVVRDFLGQQTQYGLAFDAVLHLVTALAVLIYFRREVWSLISGKNNVLLIALAFGTIPAVVLGLVLEGYIAASTRNSLVVAWMLILGSLLLIVGELFAKNGNKLSGKKGFWIGMYQALALAPGISRSGASISGGLLFGLDRETATRFAFLLSFPVILGAGLVKLFELGSIGLLSSLGAPLLLGSLAAFVVGMFAIHFMVGFLRNHKLYVFALYRVILALLILLIF